MKKRIFSAILATLMSIIVITAVLASQLGTTSVVTDESSNFVVTSGPIPYQTSIGRSGGAHKYLLNAPPDYEYRSAKWRSYGSTTINTYYKWYVWIPLNGGYYDAGVRYYVRNTQDSFYVTVNQENWANVWVYLGEAWGNGDPTYSYTQLNNNCASGYACDLQHDVWWDDAKYYPKPAQ
jgi:hypothetical protein